MMDKPNSLRAYLSAAAPLVMLVLALAATVVGAADINTPKTGSEADAAAPAAPSAEQAPKCYNGCLNWGQMCNIDPRGVYKCQRRCEKFGEICE